MVILLIWSCPDVTADRLLFNVLWTLWIYVGATLEDEDMKEDFGDAYREYRKSVPMLVPSLATVLNRFFHQRDHSSPRSLWGLLRAFRRHE
jgi:hypothetical protein